MRRLLVLLGIASSMCVAIPAHADPSANPTADAGFVEALQQAGISFTDSKSAVNAGNTVCEFLGQGKSMVDVIALVMQQNSAISNVNAAKFTAIAESAYCPQYLPPASSTSQPPPDRVGGSGGTQ